MMDWFKIKNSDQILTPALLFYPERIKTNILEMIRIAGSPKRLRPHIKTYKCAEIVQMQIDLGISKFKCSTLVEAELLGKLGVSDVLVAYPLIGPAQVQFINLITKYPSTQFSVLIDDTSQINGWENLNHESIDVFIDLNVGMNRTGILPLKAFAFHQSIDASSFRFRGLHVYDGHIHDQELEKRTATVEQSFESIEKLIHQLGNPEIEVVCGGSLSFPIHAQYQNRMLSPGTTLLWDQGYSQFSDLNFDIAATLMTRVVSKPQPNLLCLDAGHKAIASEMKASPIYLPQIPDANIITHSEEHLVIETMGADHWQIGDELYGFPQHICPTVALHEKAGVVKNQSVKEFWDITARKRTYTI